MEQPFPPQAELTTSLSSAFPAQLAAFQSAHDERHWSLRRWRSCSAPTRHRFHRAALIWLRLSQVRCTCGIGSTNDCPIRLAPLRSCHVLV